MSVRAKQEPDKVYFPLVVTASCPSQKPKEEQAVSTPEEPKSSKEGLVDHITHELTRCRVEGFFEGAIVAPVYRQHKASLIPANWGVVIRLSKWAKTKEEYQPLVVKWFNGGKAESAHSMDTLYLIHAAVEEDNLREFLELQDESRDQQC